MGAGNNFKISLPSQKTYGVGDFDSIVIQSATYNPKSHNIEVSGYFVKNKSITIEYNGRSKYVSPDISSPESQKDTGGW